MNTQNHTFFDTDLQIHRLSPDQPVSEAAQKEFRNSRPIAMSEFSLVELKGNYIQSLILMRRKVENSDSFASAFVRIQNSGGRRSSMMFTQLIRYLGGIDFKIKPWGNARRILLTYIDSQIETSWMEFKNNVDIVTNDFKCSRAIEEPQDNGGKWTATIPHCSRDNTKCKIDSFMQQHLKDLINLVNAFPKLSQKLKTKELNKINDVAKKTIEKNQFPWEGRICRQVADLLIGLQSKSGKELLSSNYKEHNYLHQYLGYKYRNFPIAAIRSK